MILKKMLYVVFGFVIGFMFANAFFIPELLAQYGAKATGFSEEAMQPSVPKEYGKLVAVSGIDLYFQGNDGTVYIVRPHTGNALDSRVTVIKRGE